MNPRSPRSRSALALGLCLGAIMLTAVVMTTVALGAEPTAVPAEVLEGGDPRSEGQGPGLVGSPLLILAGVVVLGLATALLTAAFARLAQRD